MTLVARPPRGPQTSRPFSARGTRHGYDCVLVADPAVASRAIQRPCRRQRHARSGRARGIWRFGPIAWRPGRPGTQRPPRGDAQHCFHAAGETRKIPAATRRIPDPSVPSFVPQSYSGGLATEPVMPLFSQLKPTVRNPFHDAGTDLQRILRAYAFSTAILNGGTYALLGSGIPLYGKQEWSAHMLPRCARSESGTTDPQ